MNADNFEKKNPSLIFLYSITAIDKKPKVAIFLYSIMTMEAHKRNKKKQGNVRRS